MLSDPHSARFLVHIQHTHMILTLPRSDCSDMEHMVDHRPSRSVLSHTACTILPHCCIVNHTDMTNNSSLLFLSCIRSVDMVDTVLHQLRNDSTHKPYSSCLVCLPVVCHPDISHIHMLPFLCSLFPVDMLDIDSSLWRNVLLNNACSLSLPPPHSLPIHIHTLHMKLLHCPC